MAYKQDDHLAFYLPLKCEVLFVIKAIYQIDGKWQLLCRGFVSTYFTMYQHFKVEIFS